MSTTRVAQLWPDELKETLRARVGARGMTAFTVAAVEEKLAREQDDESDRARPIPQPARPAEPATKVLDTDVPDPDACPNCGAPLVLGECWACA